MKISSRDLVLYLIVVISLAILIILVKDIIPLLENQKNKEYQLNKFSKIENVIDSLKKGEKVTISYSIDSPPYSYEDGNPSGKEVDLIESIFSKIVKEYEINKSINDVINWKPTSVSERLSKESSGEGVDIYLGAISFTDRRCGTNSEYKCITNKIEDISAMVVKITSQINNFCSRELAAGKIAAIAGTNYTESSSGKYDGCKGANINYSISPDYPDRISAIASVTNGATVGYISDFEILNYYLNKYPNYKNSLKIIQPSNPEIQRYSFLFPLNHVGLKELIRKYL